MWRKGDNKGFSLIEMLVVIAILIVLASIAAPSLFRAIRAYQAESNMRRVAGVIQRARAEAARRNQRVQTLAVKDATTQRWRIGLNFPDAAGAFNGTFDAGEPWIELPNSYIVIDSPDPFPFAFSLFPGTDYDPVRYHTRITFSPRGTVVRQDLVTLAWQTAPDISVFYVYEWRTGGIGWQQYNHYFPIAVTPAGRVRPWVYQGGMYVPK